MKKLIEERIKNAMRNGDTLTRDTLRVLKGEIERNEDSQKTLSDLEIQKMAKKMVENLQEVSPDSPEIEILKEFTPNPLTLEELTSELESFIVDNGIENKQGLGLIMKHFKTNFDGRYDGKVLSELIKNRL